MFHRPNSTRSLPRQPRITILEARTLCSGASGRNSGHLRDSPFMYFGYLTERFGLAAAKKMAAFRGSQIPEILSIAEVEGLHEAAEIMMTEGVDIVFEGEDYERLVKEAYGNRSSNEEEQEYIRLTNDMFPEILETEEARRVSLTLLGLNSSSLNSFRLARRSLKLLEIRGPRRLLELLCILRAVI